jgi:hypothetical protein
MKLLLGAILLTAVVLAASACGSSHRTSRPPASGPTVSASRLIFGGAVRCTATLKTPVRVGQELGVSVSFHNISKQAVNVRPAYGGQWVLVKSPDGTTYDTRVPLENELLLEPPAIPIQPGATATRQLRNLRVRWAGPLRITPGCDLTAAPAVRVAVTSPGLPPSETAAVNDVVAATGHLLDHCRPRTSGVSVVGQIDPPSGNAPPLQARCSISLQREPGFYVAHVLVVAPPDLRGVHIQQPYETLSGASIQNGNTQAIAWEFVVTRQGATSVNSAMQASSRPGGHLARDWLWSSSGAKESVGMQCGAGSGGSGNADGPNVTFVSVCGS